MTPERIAEIAHGYAEFCIDSDFLRIKKGIQDAIEQSLAEETERFMAMERTFTQIADYLGVEQGNVPGLLEAIQGMKNLYEASDRLIAHIGAYGCAESDNEFVLKVLGCLNKIDNG